MKELSCSKKVVEVNIWLAFITAVLIIMSTPGPSQLLMLSNTVKNGMPRSLFTAAGDLTANFIQMVVASLGLVTLIQGSSQFFMVVKWAGVVYLVYLGLRLIFLDSVVDLPSSESRQSSSSLYWQGFVTSAANPKAVIFFAALFPQFIEPAEPLLLQFIVLSATYLTIDGVFLCLYGKFAELLVKQLITKSRGLLSSVSGIFLIGAAILLGLKDLQPK